MATDIWAVRNETSARFVTWSKLNSTYAEAGDAEDDTLHTVCACWQSWNWPERPQLLTMSLVRKPECTPLADDVRTLPSIGVWEACPIVERVLPALDARRKILFSAYLMCFSKECPIRIRPVRMKDSTQLGVFAARRIRKGSYIAELPGFASRAFSDNERKTFRDFSVVEPGGVKRVLVGPLRCVNSVCDRWTDCTACVQGPNCQASTRRERLDASLNASTQMNVANHDNYDVSATKDIEAGEELLLYYGPYYFNKRGDICGRLPA